MYTISERLKIAWKWLLSFSRAQWTFDDYPVHVRRNPVDDPSIQWIAQFLNWPGPGASEPIRFASSSRVNADPALLEQFIENVLGFHAGDPVFISDESSLRDFGDEPEVERLQGLIRSNFGVDASDLEGARIAEILERIAAQRTNSTGAG